MEEFRILFKFRFLVVFFLLVQPGYAQTPATIQKAPPDLSNVKGGPDTTNEKSYWDPQMMGPRGRDQDGVEHDAMLFKQLDTRLSQPCGEYQRKFLGASTACEMKVCGPMTCIKTTKKGTLGKVVSKFDCFLINTDSNAYLKENSCMSDLWSCMGAHHSDIMGREIREVKGGTYQTGEATGIDYYHNEYHFSSTLSGAAGKKEGDLFVQTVKADKNGKTGCDRASMCRVIEGKAGNSKAVDSRVFDTSAVTSSPWCKKGLAAIGLPDSSPANAPSVSDGVAFGDGTSGNK